MSLLCNNCEKENRSHAKFCVHCGASLEVLSESPEKDGESHIIEEEAESHIPEKDSPAWYDRVVAMAKEVNIKDYAKAIHIDPSLISKEKAVDMSKSILNKASGLTHNIVQQVKDISGRKKKKEEDDPEVPSGEDETVRLYPEEDKSGAYNKDIKEDPRDLLEWCLKGESLERQEKYEEAIICYDKAMELNPEDFDAPVKKGRLLARQGRYTEAFGYYRDIIENRAPGSFQYLCLVRALNELGQIMVSRGNYSEGAKCYDKVLEYNPENHHAWCNKGKLAAREGNFPEALEYFDRALEYAPSMWDYLIEKARVLEDSGDYVEALKCYDKLMERDPENKSRYEGFKEKAGAMAKDPSYCYSMGEKFSKGKEYDEAIKYFDKALKLKPEYADAWSGKGYALYMKGDYSEAEECYDKALELMPDFKKVWYNKALLLGQMGKYREAEEFFDKILTGNPGNYRVLYNKGVALDKQGKHEEAIECFDRAIEKAPGNFDIWYNRGLSLFNLKKYEEAIKCFDKSLEINPKNSKTLKKKEETIKFLKENVK